MTEATDNEMSPRMEAANRAAVAAAVAAHPFLRGLAPEHINALTDNAMFVSWNAGDVIFREGDPANRFYLIQTGRVALESIQRDQPPKVLQQIGAGEVLGWSWLFPPYYWHFDAVAAEPSTAIFFYGTRLREQCEQDHELGYELLKRMSAVVIQRLQMTRAQLLAASRI